MILSTVTAPQYRNFVNDLDGDKDDYDDNNVDNHTDQDDVETRSSSSFISTALQLYQQFL